MDLLLLSTPSTTLPAFLRLAPELHLAIISYLPDLKDAADEDDLALLQLRRTNHYFHNLVPPPTHSDLLSLESALFKGSVYACKFCLCLQPTTKFASAMLKGKTGANGKARDRRFCAECGFDTTVVGQSQRYCPGTRACVGRVDWVWCKHCRSVKQSEEAKSVCVGLCKACYSNEADLLPYRDWLALPFRKKEELYREYEADRRQYKDQMRKITESLQLRKLGCTSTKFNYLERLSAAAAHRNTAEVFYQAVSRLSNLTRFSHQPGSIFNKNWGRRWRWRNIRFCRNALSLHTSDGDDEDIEDLQLSVALYALGQTPQVDKLDRISLCVGGPAFWGWKRLRYLWNGQGCGNIRACREEFGSAVDADEVAFKMFRYNHEEEQHQKEAYSRRPVSMKHALINLTRLDCVVSEDAYSGALSTAATPLFKFLCGSVKLENISLTFGKLFNGRSKPGPLSDSDGSAILLGLLAKHKPWSSLRQLQLQVATDKDTLLRFLSAHKETLRILTLSYITLTPGYRFGDIWESVLTELARSLKIDAPRRDVAGGRQVPSNTNTFQPKREFLEGQRRTLFFLL